MRFTIFDLSDAALETGLAPSVIRQLRGDSRWLRVVPAGSRGRVWSLGDGRWVIIPKWCLRPHAIVEERVAVDGRERWRFFVEQLDLLSDPGQHDGMSASSVRRVEAVYSDRLAAQDGLIAATIRCGQVGEPVMADALGDAGEIVLDPDEGRVDVVDQDVTQWLRAGGHMMLAASKRGVRVIGGEVKAEGENLETALTEWWWAHVWKAGS